MPQIRCPNCGALINLEIRRDADFIMILNALRNNGRTFTELLKITKLPRKTLSLRLKQLILCGRINKNGKFYTCNGEEKFKDSIFDRELHLPANRKLLALLLLIVLGIPSISLALALMSQQAEPQPLGYLRAVISVNNVNGVYAWQVAVRFNHSNLQVKSIEPGNFLTGETNVQYKKLSSEMAISEKTFFTQKILHGKTILACETLLRDVPEVNGSGTLLIIVFAYFYNYDEEDISIIYDENSQYRTMLLHKDETKIPIDQNIISLRLEKLQ
ncbi:MAG: winged helix-turn-helix domain-containing protein [Nitrososphaerota archaeon]